ncbi:ABC transporter ATP-binding protein/permease [Spiroplasma gladiatoris]|uniref:ABC transporter ATP-binding protein/permease n=1 Tax=Spiroplasma gladiatoris TaxID=2143 RepID=A0A4P7AJA4_9MOLU|nr:ABC transporter ATP-binding protein [Spiroplasma gladiatoris]QBQ07878.1 ABC transporter ATP-binding protein/permease [Spiroplasma gladiatoris]
MKNKEINEKSLDDPNLKETKESEKQYFKKKPKSNFLAIIGNYLKTHIFTAIILILIAAISSATSVLGPKIIQYMMKTLLVPTSALLLFHQYVSKGNFSIGDLNDLLDKSNSGVKLKGDPNYILSNNDESLISNSKNYFTSLGNLDLGWVDWIYVQIALFILLGITTYLSQFIAGIMGKNIEIDLRNKALERLVKQDMSYYSDKKIGEILTKIVSDTQTIGEQAQQVPVTFMGALFTFCGSIATLSTIDLKLTGVVVLLMISIFGVLITTFGIVKKIALRVRKSITNINGDVTDRIATIRLIKASGTENYETERFKKIHIDYNKKSRTLIATQSSIITVITVGISSIQVAIVVAAALMYYDTPAYLAITLSSFISGIGTMVGPIMQITRLIIGLIQASAGSIRINEIIKSKSILDVSYEKEAGLKLKEIKGDIIFKDIEFAYPEKPEKVILPKFSFKFEHGKSYAFVGETGAGKSTIAKMLLRFYDPSNGQILINGNTDLRNLNLSSYLDKVGYVEQEPQILYGNVFDNVKYGRFDATDEEVIDACKKANLDEIIMSWPEKYNTILGERGMMLSGGQKQRLVIARMILKDPELLILDEATSALDNIVEKEIQKELDKLMVGRTSISIAHRLSTIKNCDQIIVLGRDQGVVQIGTFEELKKQDGHFKKLYEAGLMD